MKRKKKPEEAGELAERRYERQGVEPMVLHDRAEPEGPPPAMVRTQVYLTRAEHDFLTRAADRQGEAMSSVLRQIIDEKMTIPEEAWTKNPMLEPTPDVPGWEGMEDGAINHDHYIYGGPKKYEKRRGEWVPLPPIEQ
jgi:hypothetical protein